MGQVNKITRFHALNNGPGPDGHGRSYPQVSFQDPYVRFTETGLLNLLYSNEDKKLQQDMRTVFRTKAACQDLVYSLFIERTKHAKTTMSMRAAANTEFFNVTVPVEREYRMRIQQSSKSRSFRSLTSHIHAYNIVLPLHQHRQVKAASALPQASVTHWQAFPSFIRVHCHQWPCGTV